MSRLETRTVENRPSTRDEFRDENVEDKQIKASRSEFKLDPDVLRAIETREEGNPFYFNEDLRPVDMTYEWKRFSMGGMEDKAHQGLMKRMGWTPVPAERHPEVGNESTGGVILVGGQMLMERHVEYTKAARKRDQQEANGRLANQFEHLKIDDNPHMPTKVTKLNRTYASGQEVE